MSRVDPAATPYGVADMGLRALQMSNATTSGSFGDQTFSAPLTEEAVVELRKMAGDRGMDIMQLQNSEISYLIGKFITFESADEYANLLKRNCYWEAQVAAWLGRKEIPVETAKQLFDNLK